MSFQTLLDLPIVVGGRTALELQGFGHYATGKAYEIFLYGPKRPPAWAGEALPDVHSSIATARGYSRMTRLAR